jgi:hypothetical protein
MCDTFGFMLRPSRPDQAENGRTFDSRKDRQCEPKSCGSGDVENAKDHAHELGLAETFSQTRANRFNTLSDPFAKPQKMTW